MIDEMSILDDNGSLTYNKQKIANSFNDYFSSIAENLLQSHQDNSKEKLTNSTYNIQHQTYQQTYLKLFTMHMFTH